VTIRFAVCPRTRLVVYTIDREPMPRDALAFLDAALAHPSYRRGFGFLGEGRGRVAPDAAFNPALAREVRARVDLLAPCKWTAVVASPAGLAMVRTWAAPARGGGVEVAPFLTVEEAVEWAGASTAEHHALSSSR
jgi:hypothetical protein